MIGRELTKIALLVCFSVLSLSSVLAGESKLNQAEVKHLLDFVTKSFAMEVIIPVVKRRNILKKI